MNFILAATLMMTLVPTSQEPANAVSTPPEITIGLAGDTMIGNGVNQAIAEKGYLWPWGTMLTLLQSTDVNLVNLETTLTHRTKAAIPKLFNFRADPDKVKCLKEAHIQVVNLANNHSLDFGSLGLLETWQVLHEANITTVGVCTIASAFEPEIKEIKPPIIEKKGIRVGIIGTFDGTYSNPSWQDGTTSLRISCIEVGNIAPIKKAVSILRPQVDLIILSMHWGPNWRQEPTPEFQRFAHQVIDAGVDIFHGHSAHIFQGIEVYKHKLILYDTGDFVDDYEVDVRLRNDQACFFIVKAQKNRILQLKIIPTFIFDKQVSQAPDTLAHHILERMRKLSKPFGTNIDEAGIITISE